MLGLLSCGSPPEAGFLSLNPQTLTQKMGDVVGSVRVSLHVGCAPHVFRTEAQTPGR